MLMLVLPNQHHYNGVFIIEIQTAGQLIEIAITGLAIINTSKTSIKKFTISFINCPADNTFIYKKIKLTTKIKKKIY